MLTITPDSGTNSVHGSGFYNTNLTLDNVPEPSTLIMMGAGLIGLSVLSRKFSNRKVN